ncbi:MAG: alpha/beta fold hydrolase [Bacilli bacterium]|nr:alpha/beta fold hydrolase [Bacilli bacterium]
MSKDTSFYLEGTNHTGVLLCHGLGGTPSQMKELGIYLNKLGYTVSCPKYRGHGYTIDELVTTNVSEWYDDLVSGLVELQENTNGFYVMGISMGGSFAVKVAQYYDVLGLVTFNAPLIGFPLQEDILSMKSQRSDSVFLERYAENRLAYFRFVTEIGQSANLEKITAPLLVFQGEKDLDRYKTSSAMLMEYTKSSKKERHDFKHSGHMIILEKEKDQVFEIVKNFL